MGPCLRELMSMVSISVAKKVSRVACLFFDAELWFETDVALVCSVLLLEPEVLLLEPELDLLVGAILTEVYWEV